MSSNLQDQKDKKFEVTDAQLDILLKKALNRSPVPDLWPKLLAEYRKTQSESLPIVNSKISSKNFFERFLEHVRLPIPRSVIAGVVTMLVLVLGVVFVKPIIFDNSNQIAKNINPNIENTRSSGNTIISLKDVKIIYINLENRELKSELITQFKSLNWKVTDTPNIENISFELENNYRLVILNGDADTLWDKIIDPTEISLNPKKLGEEIITDLKNSIKGN